MKSTSLRLLLPVILSLFVGLPFVSCKHGNPVVDQSLDRIESLVEEHRDSALLELISLDSLITSGNVHLEGDAQHARYALLKTQTHDKNFIDDTNDSLILHAVRYYDDHGSKRERMLAHFYHGAIFRNAKDYGAAFVAYRQAESLALDLNDDYYLTRIYGNLYTISNDTYGKDAIMYAQKNLEYARKINDAREAFQAKADMARYYSTRLIYDTAEILFRQVLDSLPASDPIVQYCLTPYIEQCISSGKIQLADSMLSLLTSITLPINLLNKACVFQTKGMSDSAELYVRRAKPFINTSEQRVFFYEKLSWISEMKDDIDSTFFYKQERIRAQNEIMTNIFSKSVADFQRDYELQQKQFAENKYTSFRRKSSLIATFCFLLTSILIFYLIRRFKTRSRILDEAIIRNVEQSILLENQETTIGELKLKIGSMEQNLQKDKSTFVSEKLSVLIKKRFSLTDRLAIALFKTQGLKGKEQSIYETVDKEVKYLLTNPDSLLELDRIIDELYDKSMTKAKTKEMNLNDKEIVLLRYMLLNLSVDTLLFLLNINDRLTIYKRKDRLKIKLSQSKCPYAVDILSSLAAICKPKKNKSDNLSKDV